MHSQQSLEQSGSKVVPLSRVYQGGTTLSSRKGMSMATNKPQVKAYITPENYIKIKTIAANNKRSISNMLEYIIEKTIESYEKEHGEIKLEE